MADIDQEEEESIQKANLLVNLLVNALRTANYFCSATASKQRLVHFPGDFFPWIYMHEQQRKRYSPDFHLQKSAVLTRLLSAQPHSMLSQD